MKTHASKDSVIANGPYSVDSRTINARKVRCPDRAGAGIQPEAAPCRADGPLSSRFDGG